MKNTTVDIEYLIRRIENLKPHGREWVGFFEGLNDPHVLAQHTQYMLGSNDAFDAVIRILRDLQRGDDDD